MAIDREGDIAALKAQVPPQFRPENNPVNLQDDFGASHDDAGFAHDKERLTKQLDDNLSTQMMMNGEGGTILPTGRLATAAAQTTGVARSGDASGQEKKKQDDFQFLLWQLDQINTQIEALQDEIEQLRADIADIETAMEERYGADWREKSARGELDDDPDVLEWKEKNEELVEKLHRLAELEGQKAEVEAQMDDMRRDNPELTHLSKGQDNDAAKALSLRGEALRAQINNERNELPGSNEDIEQELDMAAEFLDDDPLLSEEDELAAFERERARIEQEVADPLEQAAACQNLIENLSPQARENLTVSAPELFQDTSSGSAQEAQEPLEHAVQSLPLPGGPGAG